MSLSKLPDRSSPFPTEDVIELVDAALAADYTRVHRIGGKIARALSSSDEEAAKRLRALIRRRGVPLRASGYTETLPVDPKSRLPLIEEQPSPTTPAFLDAAVQSTVASFLSDVTHAQLLSEKGIAARLCMLISGRPGTGKSLLAGHVAAQLNRPLYVVRLDSVISSLLGDTAKNIRAIFDAVPARGAILFIDEMDALAKLRDDRHELGELKRVVNTLIQGLDSLDDEAIVVAATNHPQLLDPAIWRRFPYKVELGLPSKDVREDLWRYFLLEDDQTSSLPDLLAKMSQGLTGAEIQTIALAARRQALIGGTSLDPGAVSWAVSETAAGRLALPDRCGLSSDQKRKLALTLAAEHQATGADIARLLGVTRQAVSGYLREGN